MKNKLNLDILCNPYTHNKLKKISNEKDEFLIDVESGQKFLIQDNIPAFISSSDINGTNEDSTKLYSQVYF